MAVVMMSGGLDHIVSTLVDRFNSGAASPWTNTASMYKDFIVQSAQPVWYSRSQPLMKCPDHAFRGSKKSDQRGHCVLKEVTDNVTPPRRPVILDIDRVLIPDQAELFRCQDHSARSRHFTLYSKGHKVEMTTQSWFTLDHRTVWLFNSWTGITERYLHDLNMAALKTYSNYPS